MEPRVAIALLRSRRVRGALATGVLLIILAPVMVAAAVTGLLAHQEEATCGATGLLDVPAGGGPLRQGQYAAPLQLAPEHSYQVGATEYGGPGDPTSGSYGSIPNPGESYLPAHPDTFAELSVLASNPANGGSFTFADAAALDRLPYLTALRGLPRRAQRAALQARHRLRTGPRATHRKRTAVPARRLVAGRPDARGKSAVQIQLPPPPVAPEPSKRHLEPAAPPGRGESAGGAACPVLEGAGSVPLPITPGARARILPSGLAAAGEEAPAAVKDMVAAGNRLHSAAYLCGGVRHIARNAAAHV